MKLFFSYMIVADSIYKDFIENQLDIGDTLPTEQELVDYYKVSRTTIRRGIKKLVKDHFVYTIQGSGTFVKGKKQEFKKNTLISFYEDAKVKGCTPITKVIGMKIEEASKEIAKILGIRKGSLVYNVKRVRYFDNIPNHVEIGYLPVALFPDFSVEILSNSIYQYVEQTKKMKIKNNHLSIEPMLLDIDTAKLLQTQPDIPSLCMKAIGFLDDGTIFEYTETTLNTNKHNLSFDINRRPYA